ncbi:MAG: hypothetical protein K0R30_396 [Ornithinibacter sp.]|jgi:hypothetical protein|nr:hypothetical protein [Ornithinibacter sp.]
MRGGSVNRLVHARAISHSGMRLVGAVIGRSPYDPRPFASLSSSTPST